MREVEEEGQVEQEEVGQVATYARAPLRKLYMHPSAAMSASSHTRDRDLASHLVVVWLLRVPPP